MAKIDSNGFKELVREVKEEPTLPDNKTNKEIDELKVESLSLQNQNFAQNMEQRKRYADLIFTLVCVWLVIVLMIVVACGKSDLKLSDTVLSILLGTTTTNVCGFLLFVVKYLFNVESPNNANQRKTKNKKKK